MLVDYAIPRHPIALDLRAPGRDVGGHSETVRHVELGPSCWFQPPGLFDRNGRNRSALAVKKKVTVCPSSLDTYARPIGTVAGR